jgi:hypothetical protein
MDITKFKVYFIFLKKIQLQVHHITFLDNCLYFELCVSSHNLFLLKGSSLNSEVWIFVYKLYALGLDSQIIDVC